MSEQEKPETHAAVIAEMRIFKCRNLETGELELCNAVANYFADRLEAAHRRELATGGNAAKLREALTEISKFADDWESYADTKAGALDCIYELAQAALAAPSRNCDVHTVDELKAIFNSELISELPIANEHEKNLVSITAMGVIDTLHATAAEKEGGAE